MIFANHAHVFPKEIRPEGTVEKLLELMDECGIGMAVCYPPFHDRFRESGFVGDPNDWLAEEIKGNERLIGFGNIDFEKGNLAEQVDKIAALGFKGIKMHPPYQEFVIDGPEAFEVYARAEELGLFISFHSGMHWHRLRDNRVILFDEVAWNFPKLKFSMEHIGGYHFYREALAVMCNNSRNGGGVYAGWTSVGTHKGKDSVWALTDEELAKVSNRELKGMVEFYKSRGKEQEEKPRESLKDRLSEKKAEVSQQKHDAPQKTATKSKEAAL